MLPGLFMGAFSIMITTTPVILPVLKALPIDLVWFGVVAVVPTEAGLISPPSGLNLFVIQGIREKRAGQERRGTIRAVSIGVLPFFAMMLVLHRPADGVPADRAVASDHHDGASRDPRARRPREMEGP